MIILLESTINLLISAGEKETVETIIKNGELKQTKEGMRYIKLLTNE